MLKQQELIPHLFRTEYRKIVAVLTGLFGFDQIEIAEDIAADTFLIAVETWGLKGLPENPTAWLYNVAKNNAKNSLKKTPCFLTGSPLLYNAHPRRLMKLRLICPFKTLLTANCR